MTVFILIFFAAVMLFFLIKAWQIWKERFHSRDDNYELMQMHRLLDGGDEDIDPIQAVAVMAGGKLPKSIRQPAPAAQAMARSSPVPENGSAALRKNVPVLDAPAQEIYLRLHAEMPQIPLLACVDVALLTGQGVTPPRVQADFVLCKKDFTPAVVIFIDRTQGDSLQARAEQLLRQQRLRVLRWSVDRLPSREEMRKQIFRPKAG